MTNPYRLRTSDLFLRSDDNRKENPRRIVFVAVEGNRTEVDYFKHLDRYRRQIGISSLVRIEIIRRSNDDTNSDPYSVLNLLKELVDLHDRGIDESKLIQFLPENIDIDYVRRYLHNVENIPYEIGQKLYKRLKGRGIDIAYLKFVSTCDDRDDVFCVVLDRDSSNHSKEQLCDIYQQCKENGYKFFITSPCFEFWLLLHLCDVRVCFSGVLDDIKENVKVSNKHTFLSEKVSSIAKHGKSISEKTFCEYYLKKIDFAIQQSLTFETNTAAIIENKDIGTNFADLFKILKEL